MKGGKTGPKPEKRYLLKFRLHDQDTGKKSSILILLENYYISVSTCSDSDFVDELHAILRNRIISMSAAVGLSLSESQQCG